jgi:hypothetical protein
MEPKIPRSVTPVELVRQAWRNGCRATTAGVAGTVVVPPLLAWQTYECVDNYSSQ